MGWDDWQTYIPLIGAAVLVPGAFAYGSGYKPLWAKVRRAKADLRHREVNTAKALHAILLTVERHGAEDNEEVQEIVSECMSQLIWRCMESDMLDAWTWPHKRPDWYEVSVCEDEYEDEEED